MAGSRFVYQNGERVEVGVEGSEKVAFVEGQPVPDTNQSTFVFENGVGIGSGWKYRQVNQNDNSTTNGNFDHEIGANPFTYISHDGSITTSDNSAVFGIVYREIALPSRFEVVLHEVGYTGNDPYWENNFSIGAANTASARPFDNKNVASMALMNQEDNASNPSNKESYFEVEYGDGSQSQDFNITNPVDWSVSHDLTFGFDGTDAYYILDGVEESRISAPDVTYYVSFSLEDDQNTTEPDRCEIPSVTVRDLT